jgi:uncharacterized protein
MHAKNSVLRELVVFLSATFAATTALAFLAKFAVPALSPMIMLVPMLAAMGVQKFIARRPVFRGGELGFQVGRKEYLLTAPLLFGGFVVAALGVTVLLQPAALVSSTELVTRLNKVGVFDSWSMPLRLAGIVALECVLGPIVNLPIFLGEEVGWRAFMVPRLERLLGRKGTLVGGVVWAVWHLPMIFLFGLNYPDHPLLGLLLWIPICICLSVILQHIFRKSRSVFAVALAHGAMNKVAVVGISLLIYDERVSRMLFGPTGLVGLALLTPISIYYFRLRDSVSHSVESVEEGSNGDQIANAA